MQMLAYIRKLIYFCSVLLNYYTMIHVQDITFGYRKNQKVWENFSIEFKDGGIYGLLGKNGVGKSTLLYLISGLLRPAEGMVDVDGHMPHKRETTFLQDIFIVPEEFALPNVSLRQYVAAIRPFYPNFSVETLHMVLGEFGMDAEQHLGQLSMGQKKKVYVAVALASNTRYLLMDEPTNGLDILSKKQFRKAVVAGMNPQKTLIISTHNVHDVENLLDHVVIVSNKGVLLEQAIGADSVDLENLFMETVGRE